MSNSDEMLRTLTTPKERKSRRSPSCSQKARAGAVSE